MMATDREKVDRLISLRRRVPGPTGANTIMSTAQWQGLPKPSRERPRPDGRAAA